MEKKFWLGILIGILVSAIIGLTGFIIYDKLLNKQSNNDTTESDVIQFDSSLNSGTPVICSDCVNNIIIDDISLLNNNILVGNKIMHVGSNKVCVGSWDVSMCYYQISIDNTIIVDKFDEASIKSIHVINDDKIMISLVRYDGVEFFELYNKDLQKIETSDL